jgi:hypothetical protein
VLSAHPFQPHRGVVSASLPLRETAATSRIREGVKRNEIVVSRGKAGNQSPGITFRIPGKGGLLEEGASSGLGFVVGGDVVAFVEEEVENEQNHARHDCW